MLSWEDPEPPGARAALPRGWFFLCLQPWKQNGGHHLSPYVQWGENGQHLRTKRRERGYFMLTNELISCFPFSKKRQPSFKTRVAKTHDKHPMTCSSSPSLAPLRPAAAGTRRQDGACPKARGPSASHQHPCAPISVCLFLTREELCLFNVTVH